MKVDLSGLKKLKDDIDKLKPQVVKKILATDNLRRIAEVMANQIKKRTRVGYGVEEMEGTQKKLTELKESTKKRRKYARGAGDLSPMTTPSKSNLTETGRMLDAIRGKSETPAVIELFIDDTDRAEVAQYHHDGGRKLPQRRFMYLAKYEMEMIYKALNEYSSFLIDKIFK